MWGEEYSMDRLANELSDSNSFINHRAPMYQELRYTALYSCHSNRATNCLYFNPSGFMQVNSNNPLIPRPSVMASAATVAGLGCPSNTHWSANGKHSKGQTSDWGERSTHVDAPSIPTGRKDPCMWFVNSQEVFWGLGTRCLSTQPGQGTILRWFCLL